MDLGRVWLQMPATALVLAAGLLGCTTPAATPELTLGALEVYGPSGVTVGFTVGPSDTGIAYHGELERLDGEDSGTVWAAELAPPVNTMGTIGLGALEDGSYRLEVRAVGRRGVGSVELEFLTRVAYFLVDTLAPAVPEASADSGAYGSPFLLSFSHPELPNPAGSAVAIHVTLDGSTPTILSTRYELGAPLQIASSCQVKAVAIDGAGNSSTVVAWSYTLPGPALAAMRALAPDP